ncbi:polysaccharide biosynthesis/export family protein [Pontixanthobacter gangjinensis]|uniref:Polysaccharide export protein n=1 Tax=Christiangramia aestuarii TaxID=1028746 RepID=A0A7K1LN04_9FLAO|nr:polysaccharide biosynthesis/export family protein [Christiangramia aestuarii]MUP42182.1 polysaccharide export protein [Christiangramia aestuarii]
MNIFKIVQVILCLLLITSCVSKKKVAYFQNLENQKSLPNNIEIQPDDLLTIRVSAPEQEAALPFNLTKTVGGGGNMGNANVELETYMVSNDGTIEFPVIGTVEVQGYTSIELASKIKELVSPYVKDPIVNVRILNFKISVLGEVRSPGLYKVEDDYISLPQALSMAGDIMISGKRKNVLVMREGKNGEKRHAYLDLTDANVINSPFYNLQQNDVVYVEPTGAAKQGAGYLGTVSRYLGVASVAISLVLLFTN